MSSDHAIEPAIKPPYLGLLDKISIAERNAGRYLKAWADVTPDPAMISRVSRRCVAENYAPLRKLGQVLGSPLAGAT